MTRRHIVRAIGAALRLQYAAAPIGFVVVAICAIASGAVAALLGWLVQHLVDELARGSSLDAGRATNLAIATALVTCATALLALVAGYADMVSRAKVGVRVERSLMAKVVALQGLRHFEDPAFLGRLRLAEQAAHDAPQGLTGFAMTCCRTAVTVVSLTVVVAGVSSTIALLLLVIGSLGIVTQIVGNRWASTLSESLVHTERWRDFYRALLTDVRAAKEIRLFGLGRLLLGRLGAASAKASAGELRIARFGIGIQAGVTAVAATITAVGTIAVVDRVIAGRLTVGDVSLFLAAVTGIQAGFGGIVNQLGLVGHNALTFRHYLAVMDEPTPPVTAHREVAPLRRGIAIRDAWFRYGETGPWILRGLDLWIPAGSSVGLVGLNGAGKTTLIKLLCRFYELDRGQILWDDVDIRELDPAALHRRITATFQDFMTYDLSAGENIGLGRVEALDDPAPIRRAAELADIADQLAALPAGFATQLSRTLTPEDGEPAAGTTLSLGQWQRVALARSLMRADADLLILDEPSSGLDAEAEHRVHATLEAHGAGRTRILISHRLGTLRTADRIAVIADGAVHELGTHDELMALGGVYARLFTLQASSYQDAHVRAVAEARACG
ncbi:MAG: ABC transporter ATP-binding protein [Kofleriaceae bacterium]